MHLYRDDSLESIQVLIIHNYKLIEEVMDTCKLSIFLEEKKYTFKVLIVVTTSHF